MGIVFVGLMISVCVIIFVVYRSAHRVTHAIDVMAEFTNRLKKASDVKTKREIISTMSENHLFDNISQQYFDMKQAKLALLQRYYRTNKTETSADIR